MKKTTLLKSLLKNPPISVKSFKSSQKYHFTANEGHQTMTGQETLKIRIEKINDGLNQEIKLRQFQFRQLYKMVTDLQKSKKSKCKHSVVLMERSQSPNQMTHMPFTVLQNNFKFKKSDVISQLNMSRKNPFSINDFNELSLVKKENSQINSMKKQKRKSKFGTIKSHKYLPTIQSSSQSIQMQNQEQAEEDQKSNLETTTSQFFSNSLSHLNFNFQQKDILSPTKSVISNSNIRKEKTIEDISLKISYFENKLKSLEASQTFLKQKVETNLLKHTDFTQQLKVISSKLENHFNSQQLVQKVLEQVQINLKQVESNLNLKYQDISEETSNNFKNIQTLIYEHQKSKSENNGLMNDSLNRLENLQNVQNDFASFKSQKQSLEGKYLEHLHSKEKIQHEMLTRIEALETTQGDLFKEFGQINSLKDQKLESSKFKQSQNQSFAQPSFYSDKLSEIESRLESSEEIVSELIKVSLTLTSKINKITNSDDQTSKISKSQSKKTEKSSPNKSGLSDGYWSLKQELNKIDEEPIESSREVIDESFLYNEDNEEEPESSKVISQEKQQISIVQ